jgi:hypothetical protein
MCGKYRAIPSSGYLIMRMTMVKPGFPRSPYWEKVKREIMHILVKIQELHNASGY